MIKAIIFDWNGVIMDDIKAVARANCDIIADLGGEKISVRDWYDGFTQDWQDFFKQKGVKDKDISSVLPMMKIYYPKYKKYIRLTDDAKFVLEELKRHKITLGVLSSTIKQAIKDNIKQFELENIFDFVISGEDVINPKPHPEGLEKAICLTKEDANEIAYVDDMGTIFKEARRLGMITIGFKSRLSDNLSEADYEVDNMRGLIKIIELSNHEI